VADHSVDRALDTSVAHPARVYDYWLGGKDNFLPDRTAAEEVIATNPGILPGVRNNRAFLVRAVRWLASEAGIRQFLDLGTGLPSMNNVHEVAQATATDTKVVYVDNDPIVLVHARALLTGTAGSVDYIDADLREPEVILQRAARTLDLDRPVAVLLLMTLQFVADDEGPQRILDTVLAAVPSGSYLVISHPALSGVTPATNRATQATAKYNQQVATRMTRRTREQITGFFHGLELLEPGVVPLAEWHPELGDVPGGDVSPALCAVARKR
jgi:hypothetical protein